MAIDPIGQLASGIITTEFDYITGTEATSEMQVVSGWLSHNVGELNILISTAYNSGNLKSTPETGAFASGWVWRPEEEAIYKQVFLVDYYTKQARKIVRGIVGCATPCDTGARDYTMTDWTDLREGDTSISRQAIITTAAQKNESARLMQTLATEAREELKQLVYKYNMYQAGPRQVAGTDGQPGWSPL